MKHNVNSSSESLCLVSCRLYRSISSKDRARTEPAGGCSLFQKLCSASGASPDSAGGGGGLTRSRQPAGTGLRNQELELHNSACQGFIGLGVIALHGGEPLMCVHTQAKFIEYSIKHSFKPINIVLTLVIYSLFLSSFLPPAPSFSELYFILQFMGFTSTFDL